MAVINKEKLSRPIKVLRDHRNVGGLDRKMRIGLGAACLAGAAAVTAPVWAVVLGAAGAGSLLSAASGYCPMNQALGRDTYHPSGRG